MKMQGPEYAVFTEFSPDNKAMGPGFNTRVFTDVDSRRGDGIRCDFKTGAITLAPGSYHITGFSMATYNSGAEPPEMTTVRSPFLDAYRTIPASRGHGFPDVMSGWRGSDSTAPM